MTGCPGLNLESTFTDHILPQTSWPIVVGRFSPVRGCTVPGFGYVSVGPLVKHERVYFAGDNDRLGLTCKVFVEI